MTDPTPIKQDMPELLPCPFCGGCKAYEEKSGRDHYIQCPDCGVMVESLSHENATAWNTRSPARHAQADQDAVIKKTIDILQGYNLNGFHSSLINDLRSIAVAPVDVEGTKYNISGKDDYDTVTGDWMTLPELIAIAKRNLITAQSGEPQEPEWFYRWVSRAQGGNVSDRTAINVIFNCPNNPYQDENPWKKDGAKEPEATYNPETYCVEKPDNAMVKRIEALKESNPISEREEWFNFGIDKCLAIVKGEK